MGWKNRAESAGPPTSKLGDEKMLNYLWDAGGKVMRYTGEFNRTQWIFILIGVVVVGFLCLRGFGSRSDY